MSPQPRIGQFVSLRGRLWLVEGEGVRHVDRGVGVRARVARHHAAEQRRLEAGAQRRLIAKLVEVILFLLGPDLGRGLRGGGGAALGEQSLGLAPHPGDLGPAEQQRLALLLVLGVLAVELGEERILHRIHRGAVEARAERPGDLALDRDLGADALDARFLGQLVQGAGIVRLAPVPLEALRRDAGAGGVAERQAFGEPRVVAVEQRARPGGKEMDLDELGRHLGSPSISSLPRRSKRGR